MEETKKKRSLKYYCETKGINMEELARIVNVSTANLYLIDRSDNLAIYPETIEKIYFGTKERFNDGLKPYEYLNGLHVEVWQV